MPALLTETWRFGSSTGELYLLLWVCLSQRLTAVVFALASDSGRRFSTDYGGRSRVHRHNTCVRHSVICLTLRVKLFFGRFEAVPADPARDTLGIAFGGLTPPVEARVVESNPRVCRSLPVHAVLQVATNWVLSTIYCTSMKYV